MIFDLGKLRKLSKTLFYSHIYGGNKAVRAAIDEEGCGAVFSVFAQ